MGFKQRLALALEAVGDGVPAKADSGSGHDGAATYRVIVSGTLKNGTHDFGQDGDRARAFAAAKRAQGFRAVVKRTAW